MYKKGLAYYPKMGTCEMDGQIYYNVKLGVGEALIPNSAGSVHAADLLELPNGDLLCAWFAGTREGDSNVSIAISRLVKQSGKWEAPYLVTDDSLRSEQNPSLFLAPDNRIWLVYTAQIGREFRTTEHKNLQCTAEIRVKISKDFGETWQSAQPLFSRPGSFCRQKIQVLANGRWIFGNWVCFNDDSHYGSDIAVFQISDDEGQTWHAVEVPGSRGRVHANILEIEPGRLLAFFRSRSADRIYISRSSDNGDSWSVPTPTILPNNNSSISAVHLQNGHIAIAYNDYSANDDPSKTVWPRVRCPIAVAISEDDGETWPYRRYVEFGDGYCGPMNLESNMRYEYPVIMQSKDGTLHVAYSYSGRICIKYLSFTEAWITGQDGVNKPDDMGVL